MFSSLTYVIMLIILIIILTFLNLEYYDFYYDDVIFKSKIMINSIFDSFVNNNLLDKPTNKNNKFAIVTFENRNELEFVNLHNKNVTEYCNKWNYEYLFYNQCIHNVYWCKLFFVLDAIKTGKYDYVMWMDSDTIIKNINFNLDLIVNKYNSDIFVSLDNGYSAFCAGVFIIKNSPIGISFLEDCINSKLDKCIIRNENKLKGLYSGLCYEEGIMNKLIFEKYYKYTTCLPKYYVYTDKITPNNKLCDFDTFILHLGMSDNNLRAKCFNRYI